MRVLLSIHHALDPNTGAPGATLALGSALERAGHEVRYASFGDLPDALGAVGKEAAYPVLGGLAIDRLVRRWRPDVIDASTGDAWLWAALRRRRRPALITRSHGLEHRLWDAARAGARERPALRTRLYHGRYRLWEVARSLRAGDLVLVLNRTDRDYVVDRLGVPADRVRVVFNGVDDALLGAAAGDPDEPGRGIVVLGTSSDLKGRRPLAAALAEVLGRRGDAHASLLGTLRAPDEVLADHAPEIRDRLNVVARYDRRDLPRLAAGHQVYVSASLSEGFPLAMLEGMALGLAPVVTALPAAREALTDGETGLLVEPGDAGALAAGIERVLADDGLRARLRTNARRRAADFAWSRVAELTAGLYAEALALRRA